MKAVLLTTTLSKLIGCTLWSFYSLVETVLTKPLLRDLHLLLSNSLLSWSLNVPTQRTLMCWKVKSQSSIKVKQSIFPPFVNCISFWMSQTFSWVTIQLMVQDILTIGWFCLDRCSLLLSLVIAYKDFYEDAKFIKGNDWSNDFSNSNNNQKWQWKW